MKDRNKTDLKFPDRDIVPDIAILVPEVPIEFHRGDVFPACLDWSGLTNFPSITVGNRTGEVRKILLFLFRSFTTNPLVQRVHLTLHSLALMDAEVTFILFPGHINLQEHDAVDLAAERATESKKSMTASPRFFNH